MLLTTNFSLWIKTALWVSSLSLSPFYVSESLFAEHTYTALKILPLLLQTQAPPQLTNCELNKQKLLYYVFFRKKKRTKIIRCPPFISTYPTHTPRAVSNSFMSRVLPRHKAHIYKHKGLQVATVLGPGVTQPPTMVWRLDSGILPIAWFSSSLDKMCQFLCFTSILAIKCISCIHFSLRNSPFHDPSVILVTSPLLPKKEKKSISKTENL